MVRYSKLSGHAPCAPAFSVQAGAFSHTVRLNKAVLYGRRKHHTNIHER